MKPKFPDEPFDPVTGIACFSPVLKTTGERLDLRVDYRLFPKTNAPGYHGEVRDLRTGKRYAVYGKECGIPSCNCDAWAVEIEDET